MTWGFRKFDPFPYNRYNRKIFLCVNIYLSYTDHICLQIGKAVQKMNDLSRPVYLKSMDEEKHKPNDVLWKQAQKSDFLLLWTL